MKLVQFASGEYGVRTYWFFGWWFRDLVHPQFSWRQSSPFFHDCKGSEQKALRAMGNYRVVE